MIASSGLSGMGGSRSPGIQSGVEASADSTAEDVPRSIRKVVAEPHAASRE